MSEHEKFVISHDALGNIFVVEFAGKGRLEWQGPGIDIYLQGAWSASLYSAAANLALDLCQERHIPYVALRKVSR